jgi:hypothetical protein
MKKIYCVLLALYLSSCTIPDPSDVMACGVTDPIQNLTWLKSKHQEIKDIPLSGIVLYFYNNQEVIEIQSSLMSSTNQSQYLCDGTRLLLDDPADFEDYLENRELIVILFGEQVWASR